MDVHATFRKAENITKHLGSFFEVDYSYQAHFQSPVTMPQNHSKIHVYSGNRFYIRDERTQFFSKNFSMRRMLIALDSDIVYHHPHVVGSAPKWFEPGNPVYTDGTWLLDLDKLDDLATKEKDRRERQEKRIQKDLELRLGAKFNY